jgi:hypothetical protein
MRCTRLGLVKYDMDLMSVACHLPDVYHEQYEAVRDHVAEMEMVEFPFRQWVTVTLAAVVGRNTSRSKIQEKRHYIQTDYGDINRANGKSRTSSEPRNR